MPPTAQAWINMVLGMASLPGTLWLAMTLDDRPGAVIKASASGVTPQLDAHGAVDGTADGEADTVRLAVPRSERDD